MYWTNSSEIEIPFLANAAYVLNLKGLSLRSIHVDPSGECAISYWGCLSLNDIATVIQNYWTEDILFADALKMTKSGKYHDWFEDATTRDHPNGFTQIYTPDGIDYRNLVAL